MDAALKTVLVELFNIATMRGVQFDPATQDVRVKAASEFLHFYDSYNDSLDEELGLVEPTPANAVESREAEVEAPTTPLTVAALQTEMIAALLAQVPPKVLEVMVGVFRQECDLCVMHTAEFGGQVVKAHDEMCPMTDVAKAISKAIGASASEPIEEVSETLERMATEAPPAAPSDATPEPAEATP